MLDIKEIEKNPKSVADSLEKRYFSQAKEKIDELLKLEKERRKIQSDKDRVQQDINTISKTIGELLKKNKVNDANIQKSKISNLKETLLCLQKTVKEKKEKIEYILVRIPNIAHKSVKKGKREEDNQLIYESKNLISSKVEKGDKHWDLCKKYNLIDFELGSTVSSSGFLVYKGRGVDLQRALINFFLDENKKAGYKEVMIPLLINKDSAFATGHLPDKEGQMYKTDKEDLYLIPTSEVSIMNLYRNNILDHSDLPIKLTSHSYCLRREAGSYGKNVRGLNRLHQFEKVEIVQITDKDSSYNALEKMKDHIKSILDKLELKYRILRLCSGDMGWTAAVTYDFEVYSPAQGVWLEVSSASNCETYQSNRLKLRYKDNKGTKQLCHSLNASSLALPRIFAALIESYQRQDSIEIPKVLKRYMNCDFI